MQNKLKYILLLILLIPIKVYGISNLKIKEVYINANLDFVGSMHIMEAYILDGNYNGFERNIYYKDITSKEWNTNDEVNLEGSSFYNTRGISLSKISATAIGESDINWDVLSKNYVDFKEDKSKNYYTSKELENGVKIQTFTDSNGKYTVFYYDYYINQAVVLHNDIAELYWKFIDTNYDIDKINIQVTIPGYANEDTFRFWAHGSKDGQIAGISDKTLEDGKKEYRGIQATILNVKKNNTVDVRMTFDKTIVSMGNFILNNSNMDALDKIIAIEDNRMKNTNAERKLLNSTKYIAYALNILYIIGFISIFGYLFRKYSIRKNKNLNENYDPVIANYIMFNKVNKRTLLTGMLNMIYKGNILIDSNTLKLNNKKGLNSVNDIITEIVFKKDTVSLEDLNNITYNNDIENIIKDYTEKENLIEKKNIKLLIALLYFLIGVIIISFMIFINFKNIYLISTNLLLSIVFFIYILHLKSRSPKGNIYYLKWKSLKKEIKRLNTSNYNKTALQKYFIYAYALNVDMKNKDCIPNIDDYNKIISNNERV